MVHILDTMHLGDGQIIAVFVIETSEGLVLIEAGPESTFTNVTKGLRNLGYCPEEVRHLLVTHIHLDHAGASWRWANLGAKVYVHPKGAPHLIDPTRLLSSAEQLYGDKMQVLWGEVLPVPADRVRILQDREILKFGEIKIEAIETLGHAIHHYAYRLEDIVFTGDIAGVRIESGPALPPCPPPDFHLESCKQSIKRLKALNANQIYLTHFGSYNDVSRHLDELEKRLISWTEWVKIQIKSGLDEQSLITRFEERVKEELSNFGLDKDMAEKYSRANLPAFNVYGIVRYWRKFHPQEIT